MTTPLRSQIVWPGAYEAGFVTEKLVVEDRTLAVLSTSVENRSLLICFAITSDGKRAAYWRVRAGLKQPELF